MSKLGNDFNHAVLIGLRYNFLPPPPPPVALLLRPLRRRLGRILSCFDWDKATLTDRARQIIRGAADNSTKVPYTRVEVNGYTDTSGTTHTTRAYRCVRPNWCGMGCATIDHHPGFGDTNLLVPTGPGVREPQNPPLRSSFGDATRFRVLV